MNRSAANLAIKLESLSPDEIATVEEFVEFLRVRRRDRDLTQAAASASTPAFETVWNNPEDDVYDAL